MPMDYLRVLAQRNQFPLPVTDPGEIDKLRILSAAEMVEAILPPCPYEPGQVAAITCITGLGRATLRAETARELLEWRSHSAFGALVP